MMMKIRTNTIWEKHKDIDHNKTDVIQQRIANLLGKHTKLLYILEERKLKMKELHLVNS